MDLSQTIVCAPNHYIIPESEVRGVLLVANPGFTLGTSRLTDPGSGEIGINLHEGYLAARHCSSRTQESVQAITMMAQYMGRTESSFPSVPAFLGKMLSNVGLRGLQPSRIVSRCASLLAMLLRLAVDRSMEHQIVMATRGAPEVCRPTSWNEWLQLAEREWKGAVVFPAVMFESTSVDPVAVTRVWALILSRRVTIDGGGSPFLVTWPTIGEEASDVLLATNFQSVTPVSMLSFTEAFEAIMCWGDAVGLNRVILNRMEFYLHLQTGIWDFTSDMGSNSVAPEAPQSLHGPVKMEIAEPVTRSQNMSVCFFCKFERLNTTYVPTRHEMQPVFSATFRAGAILLVGLVVLMKMELELLSKKYVARIHEGMRSNYASKHLEKLIMGLFSAPVGRPLLLWSRKSHTQAAGCERGNGTVAFEAQSQQWWYRAIFFL